MKKKLKELIENAPTKTQGLFTDFMFVGNGIYNGVWGKNGYNKIIVLGMNRNEGNYYNITSKVDVVNFFRNTHKSLNVSAYLDIPSEYNVPHIWFSHPVEIDYFGTDSICGYFQDNKEERRP